MGTRVLAGTDPRRDDARLCRVGGRESERRGRLSGSTADPTLSAPQICINLDDWRSSADRFADSKNRDEVKLRNLILNEIVPAIEEEASRRVIEREAELAEQERKRNTRSSTREEDRPTRSSTRTAPVAAAAATPHAAAAAAAKAAGESREERLRKREEEKRRHEEEEEKRVLAEAREREREEARAQNGGVLPVELMTTEERAAHEAELAQAAARDEAEQKKKAREEAKVGCPFAIPSSGLLTSTLYLPAARACSRTPCRTQSRT